MVEHCSREKEKTDGKLFLGPPTTGALEPKVSVPGAKVVPDINTEFECLALIAAAVYKGKQMKIHFSLIHLLIQMPGPQAYGHTTPVQKGCQM